MSIQERLLEVQDLQKCYGKKNNITKALNGVSFDIHPGEFLGIMGPSGSGKTTLFKLHCNNYQANIWTCSIKGQKYKRF